MKTLQKLSLFAVVMAFLSTLGILFAESPTPIENDRELLVLRNGQILEGRITKLKNHYLVDLPNGEIQIRSSDVDFLCRSLDEGYERKRTTIQAGNWREHLELARWCLKNEMRDRANAELAAAEAASPHNPMVAALQRQMEPAAEPAAKPEKTDTYEEVVSNDELDRMVHGLPPKTMEVFTHRVQPVLMNNCIAAGCHGPQSTNNLRLFRVSVGDAANRRLTQRNLYSVMQFVNRENPEQSPLLTLPAGPHGSAANAIFTDHQANQYVKIAEWVMALDVNDSIMPSEMWVRKDQQKNPIAEESAELPSPPRLLSRDAQKAKPLATVKKSRNQPIPETDEGSNEITQTSYQEPPAEFLQPNRPGTVSASPPQKGLPPTDSRSLPPPKPKVQRGAPIPQAESKDPFDPEIFNRRYDKSDTPQEGAKPPDNAARSDKSQDKR